MRSLPPEKCAQQAGGLAAQGFSEIVVTGIEIASYGKDLPGRPGLADAVEAISHAAPGVRLRLGSLEPTVVTEDFCRRLAALGNVCPHFHLSLQSGCDDTLRRMRRKYDTGRFAGICSLLREYFPDCGLTADLICGFPGETEEDFAATLRFLERIGFLFVHAFPYSPRPGTAAEQMPGQLSRVVKEERVRRAGEVIRRMRSAYLEAQVGKTMPVLFEKPREGHSGSYCLVNTERAYPRNTVQNIQITAAGEDRLLGL